MKYKANIIGSGKLGMAIGKLLIEKELIEIKGVYNRDITKTKQALTFFNQGIACQTIKVLPPADIWMITVTDEAISSVFQNLLQLRVINENAIIFHCSGSQSSDIFCSHSSEHLSSKTQLYAASIHPMFSFGDIDNSLQNFSGTYCVLEGHEIAKKILYSLFTKIGGNVLEILPEQKLFYHIAGVMSSNYLITLFQISEMLLQKSGIESKHIKPLLLQLVKTTFENIRQKNNTIEALTGPLQRQDITIVKQHLEMLQSTPYQNLYRELANKTLDLLIAQDPTYLEIKEKLNLIAQFEV